jgi:hypothetical protein
MDDWWIRRIEGFVDSAFFAVVLYMLAGGSGIVLGVVTHLHPAIIFLLGLASIVIAAFGLVAFRYLGTPTGAKKIDCWPRRGPLDWYVREVKKAGNVSVLWNTGSVIRDVGKLTEMFPHIDRLLLPHPRANPMLNALGTVSDQKPDVGALAEKISRVTDDAKDFRDQNRRVEVRWWEGLPGNLLTIAEE